jgi:MinD-like ATPase involved in chromosome partitioning or flagellar assembly
MGPDQALADEFAILIIDDVCSFLSPRLVRRLRLQGKEVVGVFDPLDGPDAKRRLLECGISDVIEADASPDEFLTLVAATVEHRVELDPERDTNRTAQSIGVVGTPGSGVTEIAVALATDLSSRHDTVLVDLDLERSSIAQRLDLPLHPNLRTAIDYVHHNRDRLNDAMHALGSLSIVTGLPTPGKGVSQLSLSEIRALVDDLAKDESSFIVLDLGEGFDLLGPELPNIIVVVDGSSPVGMTRLIRNVAEAVRRSSGSELLAVVNNAPRSSRRTDEIRQELASALGDLPLTMIRADPRVESAAWNGQTLTKGSFARSTRRIGRILSRAFDR